MADLRFEKELPFDLNDPKHFSVASAFLAGFEHEWQQGGGLIEWMETDAARSFAADFGPAFSKYFESSTKEEHEARRLNSYMAVGVAAAVEIGLRLQSQQS